MSCTGHLRWLSSLTGTLALPVLVLDLEKSLFLPVLPGLSLYQAWPGKGGSAQARCTLLPFYLRVRADGYFEMWFVWALLCLLSL